MDKVILLLVYLWMLQALIIQLVTIYNLILIIIKNYKDEKRRRH